MATGATGWRSYLELWAQPSAQRWESTGPLTGTLRLSHGLNRLHACRWWLTISSAPHVVSGLLKVPAGGDARGRQEGARLESGAAPEDERRWAGATSSSESEVRVIRD